MKRLSLSLTVLPALLCALPCMAASHAHHAVAKAHAATSRSASSHAISSHAASSRYVSTHASRGRHAVRLAAVHHEPVPAMDPTRATAIQAALIRAGYLSGEPTGVWDADSIAAMQKLQDANGWQTKYTPDSRALVKLGLGATPVQPGQPTVPVIATETASVAPGIQP